MLALRLHFYAGVLVGPFLVVAALSGLVYAVSPTIENVVDHHSLASASADQRVPLATQIRTATERHPDLTMSGVIPGANGANTRVLFADASLPSTSYQRVVFVDPSDGSVPDDTVQYGSTGALPLRTWIDEVHRRLHLGDAGRLYAELAASWLAPITLGGLLLWWDRSRRTRRRDEVSAPRPAASARASRGRPLLMRRHAVLGTWIALGLFVLAATGLTWSTYAGGRVSDLRKAMQWSTPALTAKPVTSATSTGADEHAGHDMTRPAGDVGAAALPDQAAPVLAAARQAGLSGPVQMTPPVAAGAPWLIKETRHSWTAGPNAVSIDPTSSAVVQRLDFATWPLAAKLTDWGIRIHMGFLFGLPNQLLLAGLAGALLVMIARGYRMWWLRRPGSRFGRPPARGALRELARRRPVATVLGGALLIAVGWAIPLLGISLLGFLLVDSLIGLVTRRTAATHSTAGG
ncbi:MAG: PepSY domain-containing protein [Austwickia sp.]|nr:PepSY domain-containing protein [Austwickia sp.]